MFKELSKNTFIQLVQLLEDILFLGNFTAKVPFGPHKGNSTFNVINGGVYLEKANYAQYRGDMENI